MDAQRHTRELLDRVFKRLDVDVEEALCAWVRLLLDEEKPHSFSDLAAQPLLLFRAAKACGVEVGRGENDAAKFGDVLRRLWEDAYGVNLWEEVFAKHYTPSALLSDATEPVFALLIGTLLTVAWAAAADANAAVEAVRRVPPPHSFRLREFFELIFEDLWEAVTVQLEAGERSREQKLLARLEVEQLRASTAEAAASREENRARQLETALSSAQKQVEALVVEGREMKRTRDDLMLRLGGRAPEAFLEDIHAREAEVQRLKKELGDLRMQKDAEVAQLREDCDFLRKKAQQFENLERERRTRAENEISGSIAAAQAAVAELREQLLDSEHQANTLRLELQSERIEKKALQVRVERLEQLNKDVDYTEGELELMAERGTAEDCIHLLQMLRTCQRQLREATQTLDETEEQIADLRERCNQAETKAAVEVVARSPELGALARDLQHRPDASEVAQHLLNTVLKLELELARQVRHRRRQVEESLEAERRFCNDVSLVYSVADAYVHLHQ